MTSPIPLSQLLGPADAMGWRNLSRLVQSFNALHPPLIGVLESLPVAMGNGADGVQTEDLEQLQDKLEALSALCLRMLVEVNDFRTSRGRPAEPSKPTEP